jgi:glycosyltransferase involved in cell wall biosynthesis
MEIVHVVLGKVNTHKMNGVNKVIDNLAKNQTDLGHQVTIWGVTKNPVHNYPMRNYQTELFLNRSTFLLPKGLKNRLTEISLGTVFHFHGGFIPQFFFIAMLLKNNGFSYVFTAHGSYNAVAMERSYWKKKLFVWLFDKAIVKHAKSLHFIGESEIEGAKKIFDFSKFELIPNGQRIVESQISKQRERKGAAIFGFCGRLDIKTKGLDLLLEGFAQYINQTGNKEVELWIIGDGKERKRLDQLVLALGISAQVVFLGSVFGEQKIELIRKFDFMMLTSRNEGLPGVVLEAAALGIPSIVSKETNMAAYLNKYNAGFVLEENNSFHIQKSLKTATELIKNNKIEPIKIGAIKMVIAEFDWRVIASRVAKMYV